MRRKNNLLLLFLLVSSVLTSQILNFEVKQMKLLHFSGYYFLVPYKINAKTGNKFHMNTQCIINTRGECVFFRKTLFSSDFKVQPNGLITYWRSGKYYVLNKSFQTIDSVSCINGIETDSHEFKILPNGNYLLSGKESETRDLSSMIFCNNNKKSHGSKNAKVKFDVVQELDKNKNLVFEWRSKDHFDIKDINPVYLIDTLNVDVTHLNSIDFDEKGNILLSFRYFDEVQKINKHTGQIIWRMGGAYNQIKVLNDSIPFFGQHDAKFTSDSTISLFDNGYNYDSLQHNLRGLEYKINEKTKSAEVIWEYSRKRATISLANGNLEVIDAKARLISFGKTKPGADNVTCEIINAKNEVLQTLCFSDTMGSYRTYFSKKLPFELIPPVLNVIKQGDEFLLKTEKKYNYYLWQNGSEKSEMITKDPEACYVFLSNDGINYIRSKTLNLRKK